jgi:hypothetical protein
MNVVLIAVLCAICALIAIPAVLGARSDAANRRRLTAIGKLSVAEITEVNSVEDVVVRFRFPLPDGQTYQHGSDQLPLAFKNLKPGVRMTVRFNPKCPAVCRLEPETPIPSNQSL